MYYVDMGGLMISKISAEWYPQREKQRDPKIIEMMPNFLIVTHGCIILETL